jgi:hypothetical protein
MTCVLKNGQVIKDSVKINKEELRSVNQLKVEIEDSLAKAPGDPKRMTNFTFAHTTVVLDEVAAIKIY